MAIIWNCMVWERRDGVGAGPAMTLRLGGTRSIGGVSGSSVPSSMWVRGGSSAARARRSGTAGGKCGLEARSILLHFVEHKFMAYSTLIPSSVAL